MKNFLKLIPVLSIVIAMGALATSCKDDIMVNSIALDKVAADVQVGATLELNVVFTPGDATNKELLWRTSNKTVATVTDGTVTGVALGTATITAKAKSDTTKTAECVVTIIPSNGQTITVTGEITANTTWYSNAKYLLNGFVYVANNATLTIQPGTIIKGIYGSKGALIVERGSKLIAAGTSSQPIVFTSDRPAGQRAAGDWGGLVICGKATTNKHDSGTGIGQAEGGIRSLYGGTDDADNSGVLQYVRIEFPGIALTSSANSEINGLTLYSVGTGTTIDHIQVSYSGDDSFEWFGGTVNCSYIVALRGLDDEFDTDNGFRGKVQFVLGMRDPLVADVSGSNGFESDNDADGSQLTPVTAPVFSNVTLYGPYAVSASAPNSNFKRAMHLRRSTNLSVFNSVYVGWPKGLFIDGSQGITPTNATDNLLQIEKTILAGMVSNFESTPSTFGNPPVASNILFLAADAQAYFEATTPVRGNDHTKTVADILGANLLSLTAPVLLPPAGSSLLTGASFTNTKLTGFTVVTHQGAFGTTNWTTGWCNFDPQNTAY
jgi:hypothetical protein